MMAKISHFHRNTSYPSTMLRKSQCTRILSWALLSCRCYGKTRKKNQRLFKIWYHYRGMLSSSWSQETSAGAIEALAKEAVALWVASWNRFCNSSFKFIYCAIILSKNDVLYFIYFRIDNRIESNQQKELIMSILKKNRFFRSNFIHFHNFAAKFKTFLLWKIIFFNCI